MNHAYRLSALKLLSDIEMPELMPWNGGREAAAELVFRLGRVPAPEAAPECEPAGRRSLLRFEDGSRILIEDGRTVTLDPAPGVDPTDARAMLMAPVQAVLWHQRGLLPLHASVVFDGGGAVALAGPSGAGKSTLAAALAARGLGVMADDICVVDTAAGADVLAGTNRLRLWRDALQHLGIAAEGLPRALSRSEKFLIEGGAVAAPERQRLSAVVRLARGDAGPIAIERLRGARAIVELHEVVHMLPAAQALGLGPALFAMLTGLPRSGVAIWRLAMPNDRGCLDDAAAQVLALLAGGAASSG